MNLSSKFASMVTALSLLCTASPAYAIMYKDPIRASRARCFQVSGRERARCESVQNRVGRIRLRQSTADIQRGNTAREQRIIRRNTTLPNIRSRGSANLLELRTRTSTGVSARRVISRRDDAARAACKHLEGTAKYTCVRKETRNSSRGNVQ